MYPGLNIPGWVLVLVLLLMLCGVLALGAGAIFLLHHVHVAFR